jgi:hypothetical protein
MVKTRNGTRTTPMRMSKGIRAEIGKLALRQSNAAAVIRALPAIERS